MLRWKYPPLRFRANAVPVVVTSLAWYVATPMWKVSWMYESRMVTRRALPVTKMPSPPHGPMFT